jgi:hypothetical protein
MGFIILLNLTWVSSSFSSEKASNPSPQEEVKKPSFFDFKDLNIPSSNSDLVASGVMSGALLAGEVGIMVGSAGALAAVGLGLAKKSKDKNQLYIKEFIKNNEKTMNTLGRVDN